MPNNNPSSIKVAYFGAPASFSEEAAIQYIELSKIKNYELVPTDSIEKAIRYAAQGDVAVIPHMNSLTGLINDPMGKVNSYEELIINDIEIQIHQNLLVVSELEISDIKSIYSHPQAFAQCKDFLKKNLPYAKLINHSSTSQAALDLSSGHFSPNSAVIASQNAAALYGLLILRENIEDSPDNITRFKVLCSV